MRRQWLTHHWPMGLCLGAQGIGLGLCGFEQHKTLAAAALVSLVCTFCTDHRTAASQLSCSVVCLHNWQEWANTYHTLLLSMHTLQSSSDMLLFHSLHGGWASWSSLCETFLQAVALGYCMALCFYKQDSLDVQVCGLSWACLCSWMQQDPKFVRVCDLLL